MVAAATNAGGFGVLGATMHTPETLDVELDWINAQVDNKPYGIDLLIPNKMVAAGSRDTVRSTSRTGKPTRQLRSAWTDAWNKPAAPSPLQMPLQNLVSRPVMAKIDKLAESGHKGAKSLATYCVGQAVGLMQTETSARHVVYEFMADFGEAVERLSATLEE